MILSARCKKNSTRPQVPTREAVERMAFTEACLRETLRRYTVVPVVTREAMADTEIDGVAIPRGTKIGLHLQGTHDLWAAPQEYRPARFLPGGELEQFPEDVRRCGPRRVCSPTRLLRSLSWTRLVAKTGGRAPVRPLPCLQPHAAAPQFVMDAIGSQNWRTCAGAAPAVSAASHGCSAVCHGRDW